LTRIGLLAGGGLMAAALGLDGTATLAAAEMTTLETIRQRGSLSCGVNGGLAGFSVSDDNGEWTGFDVDYCRALAAAVFGDASKVTFVPTSAVKRFITLRSGKIDVLMRNTTWTSARDSALGLSFAGVSYYDGQGLLVKAAAGVKSAKQLDGAKVCVAAGTTTELNLATYFKVGGMSYTPLTFERLDQAVQAYLAGRCQAVSTDTSALYSVRAQQARPGDHVILPETISKEPLGPSVRQGDAQWFTIVKWVHFALLVAEELGVTQDNVDQMRDSPNPDIRLLLGTEGDFGKGLGLDKDFAARVIKAVGNYGEIFERNAGSDSRLKIARGLNNLWNRGGLQYAPPVR
jgi:general L-amino acid transport system substrate-binding protein